MPSKYPAEFDTLATNKANSTVAKDDHASNHNEANAAIMALQKTLGLNPQGDEADVVARLALPPEVEDWHVIGDPGEPDFLTGKENSDGTGADAPAWGHSENEPVAFYKDPFGVVHLRGMVIFLGAFREEAPDPEKTELTEHAFEQRALILPEGYRPTQKGRYTSTGESGEPPGSSHGAEWWLGVFPNGEVGDLEAALEPTNPGRGSLAAGQIGLGFPLDGISFRAAP